MKEMSGGGMERRKGKENEGMEGWRGRKEEEERREGNKERRQERRPLLPLPDLCC